MRQVAEALRAELGAGAVLAGDDLPERYLVDWSGLPAGHAGLLVRPASTEEVAKTLAACHRLGQPVVPQGGMTGISGGGRPGGEVVLSLERLRGIEEIDPVGATMQVLAGTPLEEAQNAAAEAGFLLPLDLGARGSCLIGGNIATNAGGNRVIRYGMSRAMVLGIEVVLADGTIVTSLNRLLKNNAGYDLKQIFIGSEGTLGVVTRAVLRLEPRPLTHTAAFLGLPSFAAVVETLTTLRSALGPSLTAFEAMWQPYGDAVVEAGVSLPIEGRHPFYVLVEQQGIDPERDPERLESALGGLMERGLVLDGALARSLADVRAFWRVRDAVAEFPRLYGALHAFDVGLPVRHMEAYTEAVTRELRSLLGDDAILLWFGHLGDGNLHLNVALPCGRPIPHEAVDERVYAPLKAIGGTVTAEHGVGTMKRDYLTATRSEAEVDLMRRLKTMLDPKGILNPGKVLPV